MARPVLFLLPPGFVGAGGRREYCPECAEMWGFLHYFPAIREAVDTRYEGIGQPREGLVALLGDGLWNCPTLVLPADATGADHPDVKTANGRRYIDSARGIARYFANLYGTPVPRGGD